MWKEQGWEAPAITESSEPDRVMLSLVFEKASDKKQAIKTSDKRIAARQENTVIEYLPENASAKAADIASLLSISVPRARAVLSKLVDKGIVVPEGSNKNRTYKLKA